ncbi:hypothetical protein EUGRSUZ_I01328 [Eucalyptus grandis]|uniref:Uncharacterized protein n=2 Tax=Eucalyptus grandis TaxID=71139 RepID=A0ACC3JF05_EUCGR|nr:hypothetical protein EUGRSUZ_I01328 [Eucalyptus grandis]
MFTQSVNCCALALQVHLCNKLASRHVRVGLADPSEVQRCDICENAPAFFYCEIDGSSLCLQCDMLVHVGGKRTHGRYLLLRQRVEFPGDKPGRLESQTPNQNEVKREKDQPHKLAMKEVQQNHRASPVPVGDAISSGEGKMQDKMIDLNSRPQRTKGQTSMNEDMDVTNGSNLESAGVVPVGSFDRQPEMKQST